MLPNSAYKLVPIVPGVDYAPATQTVEFVEPNTGVPVSPAPEVDGGYSPPIFALLCTKSTGSGNIVIQALGNTDGGVTIPAAGFVAGQVYHIYLKKFLDDGGDAVRFVGFQYQSHPINY